MVVPAVTVRYTPTRNLNPYPEIFETTVYTEADYKIPIATASLTTGLVKLNSVWLPFRPGGSSAFPSFTFLGPATESTLMPTGITRLLGPSAAYSSSQVLSSRLSMKWSGASTANNVLCVMVPDLNTASIADVYHARTSPFAKQGTFSVSKFNENTGRDGYLSHEVSPYEILAFNKQQSEADFEADAALANNDPAITQWWWIYVQTADQDVTSSTAATLQVRLQQRVRLSNYVNPVVTVRQPGHEIVEVKTSCDCTHKRPP